MGDLLVIVPSRSRPANAARLLQAWADTGAWDVADVLVAVDADDPTLPGYQALDLAGARLTVADVWRPMVHKLDLAAVAEAGSYYALGFMGDDHMPVTVGWAQRYVETLRELGAGIVYARDDYMDEKLPTHWAMTADIVRALGRMVPARVEHLFCDNAILDLGNAAGCIRYLSDVLIQHRHYGNGLAPMDKQYQRVNGREQWNRDEAAYLKWKQQQLPTDALTVRALREGAVTNV
jgi:hypothetical protein